MIVKRIRKKALAWLVAAAMVVTLIPATAFAEDYYGDKEINENTSLTEDSRVMPGATLKIVKGEGASRSLELNGFNLINWGRVAAPPGEGSIFMEKGSPNCLYNYGLIDCDNIEEIENGYIYNYAGGVLDTRIFECKKTTIYNSGIIGIRNQNLYLNTFPEKGKYGSVVIHNYGTIKGNINFALGEGGELTVYNHGLIASDELHKEKTDSTATIYNYKGALITTLDSKIFGDFDIIDENAQVPEECPKIPNVSIDAIPAQIVKSGGGKATRVEPGVTVRDDKGKPLEKDTDYDVFYENNNDTSANSGGEAIAHVNFKGKYEQVGTMAEPFNIGEDISACTIDPIPPETYTGKKIKPDVVVKNGSGTELNENVDYRLTYSNNTNVGTATVKITGMGDYAGTKDVTFNIRERTVFTPKSIASSTISVEPIPNQVYTGQKIKPDVTVKDGSKILEEGVSYYLTYSNNIYVGSATVKITGTGDYSGNRNEFFNIIENGDIPGGTLPVAAITKLTAGKGKVTVKLKDQKAQGVAGYQIAYKKKGGKYKYKLTTDTKKVIKNLKSKKTYIVKARAYKKVDSEKHYGAWSKPKRVKVL